jgi:hypothetical protein
MQILGLNGAILQIFHGFVVESHRAQFWGPTLFIIKELLANFTTHLLIILKLNPPQIPTIHTPSKQKSTLKKLMEKNLRLTLKLKQ